LGSSDPFFRLQPQGNYGPPPGQYQQGPPPGQYQQGPPPGQYQQGPPQGQYQQGPPPGQYQQGPPQGQYQQGPPQPAAQSYAPAPAAAPAPAPAPAAHAPAPAAAAPAPAPVAAAAAAPAPAPVDPLAAKISQLTLEKECQGTIRPYPNFNPEEDAKIIRKAMKGMGTDEAPIIEILSTRSAAQRKQIALYFKTMYGKEEEKKKRVCERGKRFFKPADTFSFFQRKLGTART
jgi:annexin A7/11